MSNLADFDSTRQFMIINLDNNDESYNRNVLIIY